jgi:DNA topoisomerase I
VLAMFEKGKVVERYFDSIEELAKHEKPVLHCSEKALLAMIQEGAA